MIPAKITRTTNHSEESFTRACPKTQEKRTSPSVPIASNTLRHMLPILLFGFHQKQGVTSLFSL